eukprot:2477924-Rhodomonas_salina.1
MTTSASRCSNSSALASTPLTLSTRASGSPPLAHWCGLRKACNALWCSNPSANSFLSKPTTVRSRDTVVWTRCSKPSQRPTTGPQCTGTCTTTARHARPARPTSPAITPPLETPNQSTSPNWRGCPWASTLLALSQYRAAATTT